MRKIQNIILLIILFAIFPVFFIQAQESVTITTYYPSPNGVYQELRSQKMAIGDNYYDSSYCWPPSACANQIDSNADLVVEGNVGIGTVSPQRGLHVTASGNGMRLDPVNSTTVPNPATGDIVADSSNNNALSWYDGSAWTAAGGISRCYVAYWPYVHTMTNPNTGTLVNPVSCLTNYTDMGSLGEYGLCYYNGGDLGFTYNFEPGSRCDDGHSPPYLSDTPRYIGQGHLCCR